MDPLTYEITTELGMYDVNANLDAQGAASPTHTVELAFTGVGNFLIGNYKQSNADIQEIVSNVHTVAAGFGRMRTFLISGPSGPTLSAYGNELETRGYETQFGTGAVTSITDENDVNVALTSVLASGHTGFIPLPNFAASNPISNQVLAKNKCSLGDGLVNAISAALFKKVGKNAALMNENAIITSINDKMANSLGNEMNETSADYANSKYFRRYLQSGRYAGSDGEINQLVNYTMNNTLVKCKLNIYGLVQDQDDGINFQVTDNVNQVFGAGGAHDSNGPHLINSTGVYKISCYLELKHDERF